MKPGIGKHCTEVLSTSEGVVVIYHKTRVALLRTDGTIVLNSGGWRTVTTKKRINQALDTWGSHYGLYQEKGEWYLRDARMGDAAWSPACRVPFQDGMTLRPASDPGVVAVA